MKLCILGITGMLGQALAKEAFKRNIEISGVARSNADVNFDITDDKALTEFMEANDFDIVINTCAIVNHSLCDSDSALAYQVNARPSSLLSRLAQKLKFKYIYVSTDGYFSGDADKKHDENANVVLLNEYARTKFAGEMFTLTNPDSLVVRTNIVGYKNSSQPTFVEWIVNSIKNNERLTLFNDYFTSSISVAQFSKALFDLLELNPSGIINLASSEVFSKAKFIESFSKAVSLSMKTHIYGSVSTLQSKRPDSLGLDVSKAENLLGYKLPGLEDVISQLAKEYYEIRQ